jgi:hypothetical protein
MRQAYHSAFKVFNQLNLNTISITDEDIPDVRHTTRRYRWRYQSTSLGRSVRLYRKAGYDGTQAPGFVYIENRNQLMNNWYHGINLSTSSWVDLYFVVVETTTC